MSRKSLPPAPGGDHLAAALRARHQSDPTSVPHRPPAVEDPPPAVPNQPQPETAQATARVPEQKPRSTMVRRSWYLPAETADALAELVDDLHHETRAPRHVIWAAIGAQLAAQREQLRDRLPPRT